MGRKKINIQPIKNRKLKQVSFFNSEHIHKAKARFAQKGYGTFHTLRY
jgi:hypothetical protein